MNELAIAIGISLPRQHNRIRSGKKEKTAFDELQFKNGLLNGSRASSVFINRF